jgi:hypothetical protein
MIDTKQGSKKNRKISAFQRIPVHPCMAYVNQFLPLQNDMYGHILYLYWTYIIEEGSIVKSTAGVKPGGDEVKAEYENISLVIFQSITQHKI